MLFYWLNRLLPLLRWLITYLGVRHWVLGAIAPTTHPTIPDSDANKSTTNLLEPV
ncbi:hypothetical protein [Nostoc sp.]|uniref:hypothetical protein n=1 Tax=Nostoc sp. TaxID=1180 RepID=UPI002FFAA955